MASFLKNLGNGTADPQTKLRRQPPRQIIQHDAQNADSRRQVMLCYARAAFFLSRYLKAIDTGAPPPLSSMVHVIQSLVDLSEEQQAILLSLTTTRSEEHYLVFHHVNVALMAIAFARELGFTRLQIRDVGLLALFHETGVLRLPTTLLNKPGALSEEEHEQLKNISMETLQHVLNEKRASQEQLRRIVLDTEVRQEHAKAERDEKGNLIALTPACPRSAYAELISICCVYDALRSKRPYRSAYRPENALLLMWSELRERFDPDLLRVFMHVMRIPALRLKGEKAKALRLDKPETG